MRLKSLLLIVKALSPIVAFVAMAIISVCVASAQSATPRPCDLYASTTPCVAAFSTTRALYRAYTGPLYEVTRQSDKTSINIGLLPDGDAKAALQDTFCANTSCTITKIYDQSSNRNDLTPAPPGGAARGPGLDGYDIPAVASVLPVSISGHKVYGIAVTPGTGYRNDTPVDTAVHGQAEGVYMITSALNLNDKCCFDFGNAEVDNLDNKPGHMDAINIMCHAPHAVLMQVWIWKMASMAISRCPPAPLSLLTWAPVMDNTNTRYTKAMPSPAY